MKPQPLADMLGRLDQQLSLQQQAREIKQWLRDHQNADQQAIDEQRRRLSAILREIEQSVK